jgi:hypothetical protein
MTDRQADLTMLVRLALDDDYSAALEELETWYREDVPDAMRADIRELLLQTSGSVLEPFTLSEKCLFVAERFVGICLSAGESRCRVVGDDEMTKEGGLVITRTMKSFLVHRFPLGRPRHSPGSRGWIAPELLRSQVVRRSGPAVRELTSKGLSLSIPLREVSEGFGVYASLLNSDTRFEALGWYITFHNGVVKIGAQTPEGSIKLLSACARSETLILKTRFRPAANAEMHEVRGIVQLSPVTSEGSVKLISAIGISPHPALESLAVPPLAGKPRLTLEQRQSIAAEFWVPMQWLDDAGMAS